MAASGAPRTVIMGAGVIGVTNAYYLAKEGHQVTVIDRQPVAANETSFANAGLVAPGHAYTWASPRAPKILLKSLFRDDQALRLKLNADPRMWLWCLKFLRNCTAEHARINTTRKLGLCVYSQQALKDLVAETRIDYDGRQGGLLYLYRDDASFARGQVEGERFVLALGCQSAIIGRHLGLRLPIYPVKGYSATVPIGGRNGAPSIGGVDENNLVAFARMGDRLRLTAVAEFAGYDTSHKPENFRTMLDAAKALFPQGGDYDRARFWAGLRPMTPEGTPLF